MYLSRDIDTVGPAAEAVVDNEYVGLLFLAHAHGVLAVGRGRHDVVALQPEIEQQQIEDGLIVVDDDEPQRRTRHHRVTGAGGAASSSADGTDTSGSANATVAPP